MDGGGGSDADTSGVDDDPPFGAGGGPLHRHHNLEEMGKGQPAEEYPNPPRLHKRRRGWRGMGGGYAG